MSEGYEKLAGLIAGPPSKLAWEGILEVLLYWAPEGDKEKQLAYAAEHLEDWPEYLRRSPKEEKNHPGWPLVRAMVLSSVAKKNMKKLSSPDYAHITGLSIEQSSRKLKSLDCLSGFGHLTERARKAQVL